MCVWQICMTKSEISLAPHLNQIIRRTVDFV